MKHEYPLSTLWQLSKHTERITFAPQLDSGECEWRTPTESWSPTEIAKNGKLGDDGLISPRKNNIFESYFS